MSERTMRRVALGLTLAVVLGAIGILNVGRAPSVKAAECKAADGGDGGGESPSPTESGSPSESPSPSGPQGLIPAPAQTSPSPSPSPSNTGGIITLPPILPSESASPSGSPSPSPSEGRGGERCPSKVTIRYKRVGTRTTDPRDHFKGRVRSPENACVRRRQVLLRHKRRGSFRTVARTVTKRNGRWRIDQPGAKGRYYAKASEDSKRSGRLECRSGRSRTIRV